MHNNIRRLCMSDQIMFALVSWIPQNQFENRTSKGETKIKKYICQSI